MEFEKLRDIIVEVLQIDPEQVTVDTAFEDLDADSLDVYQIIFIICLFLSKSADTNQSF